MDYYLGFRTASLCRRHFTRPNMCLCRFCVKSAHSHAFSTQYTVRTQHTVRTQSAHSQDTAHSQHTVHSQNTVCTQSAHSHHSQHTAHSQYTFCTESAHSTQSVHSLHRVCTESAHSTQSAHTHTHTQCCSFIRWHFHSDINLCFLPVNRNILLHQYITVTQYSIVSIGPSFWGF